MLRKLSLVEETSILRLLADIMEEKLLKLLPSKDISAKFLNLAAGTVWERLSCELRFESVPSEGHPLCFRKMRLTLEFQPIAPAIAELLNTGEQPPA